MSAEARIWTLKGATYAKGGWMSKGTVVVEAQPVAELLGRIIKERAPMKDLEAEALLAALRRHESRPS